MDLILPDVNVLVYAFHRDGREHGAYAGWLNAARMTDRLALPEATLLGFIRVTTNPRIYPRPVLTSEALVFVDELRASTRVTEIGPTQATWSCLRRLVDGDRQVRGKLVPDAWLAALAISHGARLATADRGFARFDGLEWFDPVPG